MISLSNVRYFVWTTGSHVGDVFLVAVKNIPPKSEGCCIVVQNIPLRGVKYRFKVSNNKVTAKCSKPLLFLLKP